ncbi:MAG: hypothetical protein AAF909_11505 [Pseudomonadota bacterium]
MRDDIPPCAARAPLAAAGDDPGLALVLNLAETAAANDGHHVLSPAHRATLLAATPVLLQELQAHRRAMRLAGPAMAAITDSIAELNASIVGGAHG